MVGKVLCDAITQHSVMWWVCDVMRCDAKVWSSLVTTRRTWVAFKKRDARVMTKLWKLAVSHLRLTRVLKLRCAQGVTAISHTSGTKSELWPSYEVLLLVALSRKITNVLFVQTRATSVLIRPFFPVYLGPAWNVCSSMSCSCSCWAWV